MFQFPRLPSLGLCIQLRDAVGSPQRISPFGHLRVGRLFTANRSLSQCPTSFIGIWRQGIHRKPLVASPRDAESLLLFGLHHQSLFSFQSAVSPLTGERCARPEGPGHRSPFNLFRFHRQGDPAHRRARCPLRWMPLAYVAAIDTKCLSLSFPPAAQWR